MPFPTGFIAYPSSPGEVGTTIHQSLQTLKRDHAHTQLTSWEQNDIAGRFIVDPILNEIRNCDYLIADVSRLNFNVTYEIGYAIGSSKRVFLIRNAGLNSDESLVKKVGMYDTLGYVPYENSNDLAKFVLGITDTAPLPLSSRPTNIKVPVYIVLPRHKLEPETRLFARIKKARLKFRIFDPDEEGRLSAREAIDNVCESIGIAVPLLSSNHSEATVHNLRAAFVTGLANALGKVLLLPQAGNDPVPLDYRDIVDGYVYLDDINTLVHEFAAAIADRLQADVEPMVRETKSFLATLNLGASSAENEQRDLGHYYLDTDEYRRTLKGEIQIVSGRKGAGKTALFFQVRNKIRQNKQMVVLDLKPEGFQLLKFKDLVLDMLSQGTKEHTITAFWEYLLLLEVCYKILEKDRDTHIRDHRLFAPYRAMADAYREDTYVTEGDFAERMLKLTQRIGEDFAKLIGTTPKSGTMLNNAQITEVLYKHDVSILREHVKSYLALKDGLWILFDNLDKGWPPGPARTLGDLGWRG